MAHNFLTFRFTRLTANTVVFFALWALLIIFYPGLFMAREASLMGDHWEQHFPWAVLMSQAIKNGIGPFWTPLIQCGFPIVAESQIGFFYLPNIILYATLPVQWAYAYQDIVHFFLSGWGTYLYARKVGLAPLGAFAAAVIFVFGTGYGGAFYNITSLKTLAWFPLILWAMESFLISLQKRYLAWMAFFISLSILAGYLQVAALGIFIAAIYFLLRLMAFPAEPRAWGHRLSAVLGIGAAFVAALLLCLPQLYLTFELAIRSNRTSLTEAYAYVGSLSPVALLTVFLPKLQGICRGNCLYSGIFAVYFVCAAFFCKPGRLRTAVRLWLTLGMLSLLLALGGTSPLYIALIKLSHFYSFRVPAKFLVFFCFSVAMLAGIGVHAWKEDISRTHDRLERLNRRYSLLAVVFLFLWGVAFYFVSAGCTVTISIGKWFATHFIYGKIGHPNTLDSYIDAVNRVVNTARKMLSVSDPWILWFFAIVFISLVWVSTMRRMLTGRSRPIVVLGFGFFFLLADLYATASLDIKKDFDSYQHVMTPNCVVKTLLAEKAAGRLGRLYGFRREIEKLPLVPSSNILFGIEDIGGYSPLILRRYYETLGRFGNIDDSNRMMEASAPFVLARLPLLNALDVSHILSSSDLHDPSLELLIRDPVSSARLYRNLSDHSKGFFISDAIEFSDWSEMKRTLMRPGFDPRKILLLENTEKTKFRGLRIDASARAVKIVRTLQGNGAESWDLETTGPGFFTVSNTMYPGWEARLNGQKIPLFCAYGLFQAVQIPGAGQYRLELTYHPFPGWNPFRSRK